jgi:hypothetical protein
MHSGNSFYLSLEFLGLWLKYYHRENIAADCGEDETATTNNIPAAGFVRK